LAWETVQAQRETVLGTRVGGSVGVEGATVGATVGTDEGEGGGAGEGVIVGDCVRNVDLEKFVIRATLVCIRGHSL
jgi:hypothetical protein